MNYFMTQEGAGDFAAAVHEFFSRGAIDKNKMESVLQKDAYLEERLSRYALLHLHQRAEIDGKLTGVSLDMNQVRDQELRDLQMATSSPQ